jgi:hypothetical protein
VNSVSFNILFRSTGALPAAAADDEVCVPASPGYALIVNVHAEFLTGLFSLLTFFKKHR